MFFNSCPQNLSEQTLQSFWRVWRWLKKVVAAENKPFIIGIGGPGGCGKTTLANWLRHNFKDSRILSLDDFRLPRDKRGKHSRFGSHPDANDHQRLFECLKNFRRTKKLIQPIFDRATGKVVQEIACDNINIVIADAVLYFNSRRRFTIRKIVE